VQSVPHIPISISGRRRHLFDLRFIDHDALLVSNIATLTLDIPFALFQRKATAWEASANSVRQAATWRWFISHSRARSEHAA
jgi:hypothetical protein